MTLELKTTTEVGSHLQMSLSSQLTKMMQEKSEKTESSNNTSKNIAGNNDDDDVDAISKALDLLLTSNETDVNEEEMENVSSCQANNNTSSSNNYIIRDVQFVKYLPHRKSFTHVLLLKLLQSVLSNNGQHCSSTKKCTWTDSEIRKLLLKYALCAESLHPYTILLLFYYCQSDVLLQDNVEHFVTNQEITDEILNECTNENETIKQNKSNNQKNSENIGSDVIKKRNKNNKYADETCCSYMLALATILSGKSALLNDGLSRAEHLHSATEFFLKQLANTHSSVLATRRFIALLSQTALTSLYCGALRSVSLMTTIIDVAVIEVYGRTMLHLDAVADKNLNSSRETSIVADDEFTSLTLPEEQHKQKEGVNDENEEKDNNVSEQIMINDDVTVKIYEYDKYVAEALETLESFAKWSLQKSSQLGVISAHLGIKSTMTKEASVREGQAREIITERNVQITPLEIASNKRSSANTALFMKTAQERNVLQETGN